ncbi:myosin light chain kinase 2, skeletal/cardiac muscle, partial [Discoglossus pictus]
DAINLNPEQGQETSKNALSPEESSLGLGLVPTTEQNSGIMSESDPQEDTARPQKDKSRAAPNLKIQLKPTEASNEGPSAMGAERQEEEKASDIVSPGASDQVPQSPVVIIGEDVFQVIDDCPPPPAPFPHRLVTLRTGNVTDLYDLKTEEALGGGRFGDVHICREKSSGLQLVAKVIKIQTGQEKEMALNEVQVMNELDHPNLVQMFDALETPDAMILFLEYVAAGELFERIIDDSFELCEVDAMVYVRQICEGVFYMHQMYVLHLDLKPENIVCVSPISHMVKIIDFGLARRYKPQEKLKVSFGTPEFLSPEVVNYDVVSFATDMWSIGVITYMMVSGLSPFLGDNDTETMNNVLSGDCGFNEESFESVSGEAKDFISNLLVRDKSRRLSAAHCLRHPWLNDLARKAKLCNRLLKSQFELRKYMMRKRWKKNFFAVTAANRFLKTSSSACLSPVVE